MQETEAQPFLAPVPTGVLDYHRVVRRPMDLGTVLARLKSGWYTPGATALHAKLIAGEVRRRVFFFRRSDQRGGTNTHNQTTAARAPPHLPRCCRRGAHRRRRCRGLGHGQRSARPGAPQVARGGSRRRQGV